VTDRRAFIAGTLALLAAPDGARAQPAKPVRRIGVLATASSASDPRIEALRHGLRELGYVEGQGIAIEYRLGSEDRLPALAAELVHLKVEVIVALTTTDVEAARQATSTIPIVFGGASDPVASGFVGSLARPGGNITGASNVFAQLGAKRLELLKETLPEVTRVAVFANSSLSYHQSMLADLEDAACTLRVQLQVLELDGRSDLDRAFATLDRGHAGALLVLPNPGVFPERSRFIALASSRRLPSFFVSREYAEAGGLMSYGPSQPELYRRAATYVDRILKGAKPADLPVEQPTKVELIINLKTAKALGLTIPQSVLLRADEVIQ
jgi:putative ABC transport system substrate-binding protein